MSIHACLYWFIYYSFLVRKRLIYVLLDVIVQSCSALAGLSLVVRSNGIKM